MNNLCVIPARGGSKRIHKKNIKNFLGRPIISYSIEAAKETNLFQEIMVSTDDIEISDIATKYGASVPFRRSKNNSNDFATISDVIEETIENYKLIGKKFDNVCCLFPTAPFAFPSIIRKGFDFLKQADADSVRPVVKFSYPIQRALKIGVAGQMMFFDSTYKDARSQDLEDAFHDAGMFYWMNSKLLKGEKRYAFEVLETECQDIDNLTDWAIAEIKYKMFFS